MTKLVTKQPPDTIEPTVTFIQKLPLTFILKQHLLLSLLFIIPLSIILPIIHLKTFDNTVVTYWIISQSMIVVILLILVMLIHPFIWYLLIDRSGFKKDISKKTKSTINIFFYFTGAMFTGIGFYYIFGYWMIYWGEEVVNYLTDPIQNRKVSSFYYILPYTSLIMIIFYQLFLSFILGLGALMFSPQLIYLLSSKIRLIISYCTIMIISPLIVYALLQ